MTACMFSYCQRRIAHPVTPLPGSPAVVHVFEPKRMKLFVKSAEFLPDRTAEHQESARGLFDLGGLGKLKPQATVVPIDRVARPPSIDQQRLTNQSGRRGQT